MKPKNCNIIHLSEVTSTNKYAKDLFRDGRPDEGSVVLAAFQTAGKGLDKNSWESEPGQNILMSMILYPDFLYVAMQFSLSMCIALGIIDFLEEYLPDEDLNIKWPNDIFVGNKKIGGILINNEIMGNSFEHVIAGIGINVNQEDFGKDLPDAVSLTMITGQQYSVKKLTQRLCSCLRKRYEQLQTSLFDHLRNEYHAKLLGMGEWRQFHFQGKQIDARITGVNEFGKLLLETKNEPIECDLKEITFLF